MAGRHWLFVFGPLVASTLMLLTAVRAHAFAIDFDQSTWTAAVRLLHGQSPYVSTHSSAVQMHEAFVYPPPAAILLAPFGLLPRTVADVAFTVTCVAAVVLTLWVCRVRDWRIYGAAFLCPAVISGWETANITLLLALGLAVLWRLRDRPAAAGLVFALLVSLKVFLWPLAVWLLASRRFRALLWSIACGLALNLAGWAIVGFSEIPRYLQLLSAATRVQQRDGYSLLTLTYGSGQLAAYLIVAATVIAASVAIVLIARRGHDQPGFALAIAVCLLASPLVWLHYYALLIVPLALARPRFTPIWLLPVLMWFPASTPATWHAIAALAIAAAVLARIVATRPAHDAPVAGGALYGWRTSPRASSATTSSWT